MKEIPDIEKAFRIACISNWDKKEWEVYDTKSIYIQDERDRIEYAYEEGLEKGKINTAKRLH